MAWKYWIGTDGDWSVGANWSPVATVPASGDNVILNGDNDVAITSGLTQTAVDLALLFIGDGFTQDIGDSLTRLTISTAKLIHRGKGALFFTAGTAGVDEIIASHTGTQQNVNLDYLGNGPTRVVISRGRVGLAVNVASAITDFVVSFISSRDSDSDVTLTGADTDITNLLMAGGRLTCKADRGSITNVFCGGGVATLDPRSGATEPTMHISNGGKVVWNSTSVAVAEANVYDGLLDFTQTREEKTATLVNLWPDGEFRFFPDLTTRLIKEFDGRTVDIG